MKLILDTHVLLWWLDEPALLSDVARDAIAEPAHEVFFSAVSAWEIAIKRRLGKLDAPDHLVDECLSCGFIPLSVTVVHALATENLPPHHRDPFDRMLIAQAMVEGAGIVTRDAAIALYGVPIIGA